MLTSCIFFRIAEKTWGQISRMSVRVGSNSRKGRAAQSLLRHWHRGFKSCSNSSLSSPWKGKSPSLPEELGVTWAAPQSGWWQISFYWLQKDLGHCWNLRHFTAPNWNKDCRLQNRNPFSEQGNYLLWPKKFSVFYKSEPGLSKSCILDSL